MRAVVMVLFAVLLPITLAAADELVFFDNFNDGNLDGWIVFGAGSTDLVWCQDSELRARASSGYDCCNCPSCRALVAVDGLVCNDFTIELKITNHNSCGNFGLILRAEEQTWDAANDLAWMDHWLVYFDPGYGGGVWQLGARVDGVYLDPGMAQGALSFGTDVPHYFRIVMSGQSLELWHRTEGTAEYSHIHTLTVTGGSTEGYVALSTSQSAKQASYDDVVIYAHETPVESSSWGRVKALYR